MRWNFCECWEKIETPDLSGQRCDARRIGWPGSFNAAQSTRLFNGRITESEDRSTSVFSDASRIRNRRERWCIRVATNHREPEEMPLS